MAAAHPLAIAALACGLAVACASAPEPCRDPGSEPASAKVARVEVALAPGAGSLGSGAAARLVTIVRQSALDWLDQRDRLAPDGQLSLVVTIDSARVRGTVATWLFAWAAAPDHLAAQVLVVRDLEISPRCPVRVESALSGYSWRDPDARLERLARRLGHRIADRL
jgi:hypothetical protein